jgi:hypothetical protein
VDQWCALLVLGGAVVLLLPNLPLARSPAMPRATMLRDGVLLLRLPIYRRLLVAAALLEGSRALHDSFSALDALAAHSIRAVPGASRALDTWRTAGERMASHGQSA